RNWLLALAGREAEDWRRLSGVSSERPLCVVEATRAWQVSRRRALLAGLVKTCNLGIGSMRLDADESKEVGRWSWCPADRNAAQALATLRVGKAQGTYKVNRKTLRSRLRETIEPVLGSPH